MKTESLKVSAVIPASPETIYKAWLRGEDHAAMTGSPATGEARIGGKFTAWEGYISGKTLELQPCSRIVQAWRTTEFADDDPDSCLEITLEPAKGGTRVTLTHSGLPKGSPAEYRKGWIDFYFKPMKAYFSGKM